MAFKRWHKGTNHDTNHLHTLHHTAPRYLATPSGIAISISVPRKMPSHNSRGALHNDVDWHALLRVLCEAMRVHMQ